MLQNYNPKDVNKIRAVFYIRNLLNMV